MSEQHCPICKQAVQPYPRYPHYVCRLCKVRATDAQGRRVVFYNSSPLGTGIMGKYADDDTDYLEYICYIDGSKCWAGEARFGGIVVQLAGEDQAGRHQ